MVGDSRGAEVRAGQAGRQLDQPEGRRSRFPAQSGDRQALRRRRRRHGVRRTGAGRHGGPEGRHLPARVCAVDRTRRIRPDRHHLRPEHPRDRDRPRRAQRVRDQLHRGDAHHQGDLSRREDQRRRQQSVVLVSRQRRRARGDSLRVPVSRDQGRHGHGDRQRRTARGVRRHSEGAPRARRGHHLQPAARRDRAPGGAGGDDQGRRHEENAGPELARRTGRGAAVARARARRHRFHRDRRRRGAAEVSAPARHHRRPA